MKTIEVHPKGRPLQNIWKPHERMKEEANEILGSPLPKHMETQRNPKGSYLVLGRGEWPNAQMGNDGSGDVH